MKCEAKLFSMSRLPKEVIKFVPKEFLFKAYFDKGVSEVSAADSLKAYILKFKNFIRCVDQ